MAPRIVKKTINQGIEMKAYAYLLTVTTFAASAVFAQVPVHPMALEMATKTTDAILPALRPMMDLAFDKLEQDASRPNAPASIKIFLQEFRHSFNRESFIAVLTNSIQTYFTDEDFSEMKLYQESRVGVKAAKFQAAEDPKKMIAPIMKEACDRTVQRLIAGGQPVDDAFKKTCGL